MPHSLISKLDSLHKRGYKPDTIARIVAAGSWVRGGDFDDQLIENFKDQHCVVVDSRGRIEQDKSDYWRFWLDSDREDLTVGGLRDYWFILADGYVRGDLPPPFRKDQ